MTKREIEKHLKQFILPAHPGYYVYNNIMYKRFGDDLYIKGYTFSAGGKIPDAMHVSYFVMPLFLDDDTISHTILFAGQRVQDRMLKRLIRETRKGTQYDFIRLIRERTELLLSKSTREERIRLLKEFSNETISKLKMAQLKPFTTS